MTQLTKRLWQPGDAKGIRPHAAALSPFARVHRDADKYDVLLFHVRTLPRKRDLRKDSKMIKMGAQLSKRNSIMDELDARLLVALQRDARATLSELAADLGVTRTTVRTRMDRLKKNGDIVGFTVVTKSDIAEMPVRGLMMLGIEGRGAERIMSRVSAMPQVRAVHSTNGSWDLIAEIGTKTLEEFDKILFEIRRIDGITRSETNLLLSTRKGRV